MVEKMEAIEAEEISTEEAEEIVVDLIIVVVLLHPWVVPAVAKEEEVTTKATAEVEAVALEEVRQEASNKMIMSQFLPKTNKHSGVNQTRFKRSLKKSNSL